MRGTRRAKHPPMQGRYLDAVVFYPALTHIILTAD